MGELTLVELSADTIVAVNSLSLKPGQEQFLAPVSYAVAASVLDPNTSWQRVVLDGDEVVGFVSANFDPTTVPDYFQSVLWRINVDAGEQGRGVGRFAVQKLIEEARTRGLDHVDVIYEAGSGGPEAFFQRVGFTPIGETEYGEVIAEITFTSPASA
jgi:diamine N-acetyltransferase